MFPPVILFSILFGLSTDYEVFLLSRVKEIYERDKRKLDQAVRPERRARRGVQPAPGRDQRAQRGRGSGADGRHHHRRRPDHDRGVRRVRDGPRAGGQGAWRRPRDGGAARLDDHPRDLRPGLDEADGPPELVDAEVAGLDPAHPRGRRRGRGRAHGGGRRSVTGRRGSAVGAGRCCRSGRGSAVGVGACWRRRARRRLREYAHAGAER